MSKKFIRTTTPTIWVDIEDLAHIEEVREQVHPSSLKCLTSAGKVMNFTGEDAQKVADHFGISLLGPMNKPQPPKTAPAPQVQPQQQKQNK